MRVIKISRLPRQTLITGVIAFIIIALLTPYDAFKADIESWQQWAFQIKLNGLCMTYDSAIVYMPGLLYILYAYDLFFSEPSAVMEHIHALKIITLLFDFAAALLVVSLVQNEKWQKWWLLLLVLNPAYLYNTVIWGQVDAMYTAFIVAAVFAVIQQKIFLSTLLLLLAINMKFQGIIYFPVLFLLWLPFLIKQPRSYFVKLLGGNLLLQLLLMVPFFIGTGFFYTIHHLYTEVVKHSPVISQSANNIWVLLKDGILYQQSDQQQFYSLSFLTWGNILFISFLALSLIPLLRIKKTSYLDPSSLSAIFLACALTSLVFFYFKTGMHERYVHPALIFLAAYAFVSRDFIPFILTSLAYFLQLEVILRFFHLNYNLPVFHEVFISLLFLFIVLYCFARLYWKGKTRKVMQANSQLMH